MCRQLRGLDNPKAAHFMTYNHLLEVFSEHEQSACDEMVILQNLKVVNTLNLVSELPPDMVQSVLQQLFKHAFAVLSQTHHHHDMSNLQRIACVFTAMSFFKTFPLLQLESY